VIALPPPLPIVGHEDGHSLNPVRELMQ
jgi:hypothetical protein